MGNIDFNKWNEDFGGEDAVKALKEAKENEYTETPDGKYVCSLEKLELGSSKKGKPMIQGQFRIKEGKHKKQCVFLNQVVTPGFPMHKGLEFLRSLQVLDDSEIDFDGNYEHLNDLILDIAEESEGLDFEVKKSTDGDFTRLEITDVFE